MSAKHTPGPWAADAEEMQQGADDIFTVAIWAPGPDGDRPHIATVNAFSLLSETCEGTEYLTTDAPSFDKLNEAKANALLIASAPDLLATLIAIADNSHDPQAIRVARTAIDKATGAAA